MELVFITSVINTSEYTKPFSYTNVRSTFSTEERFKQTQQSIETLRKYIPNSYIVLVECSNISQEYEKYLLEHCDIYYNANKNKDIVDGVGSLYKGYGEASMHIAFLKYVMPLVLEKKLQIRRFWKLSGRYYLTEQFNLEQFNLEHICFKKEREYVLNTRLYNFPMKFFSIYIDIIRQIYYETEFDDYTPSIEELFYKYLFEKIDSNKILIIEQTGLSGYEAVSINKRCFD
jgi:hypothetical protein